MKEWVSLASDADPEHYTDGEHYFDERLPDILLQLSDAFRRVHSGALSGDEQLIRARVSFREKLRMGILRQQVRLSGVVYDTYQLVNVMILSGMLKKRGTSASP